MLVLACGQPWARPAVGKYGCRKIQARCGNLTKCGVVFGCQVIIKDCWQEPPRRGDGLTEQFCIDATVLTTALRWPIPWCLWSFRPTLALVFYESCIPVILVKVSKCCWKVILVSNGSAYVNILHCFRIPHTPLWLIKLINRRMQREGQMVKVTVTLHDVRRTPQAY